MVCFELKKIKKSQVDFAYSTALEGPGFPTLQPQGPEGAADPRALA